MNSPHKGQWRRALIFSLICVWINGWVNNREAGDLRCYRVHYEVIVMCSISSIWPCDAIWHRSVSTLVQVMPHFSQATSHHMNIVDLLSQRYNDTWVQFHEWYLCHQLITLAWKLHLKSWFKSPRGLWFNIYISLVATLSLKTYLASSDEQLSARKKHFAIHFTIPFSSESKLHNSAM